MSDVPVQLELFPDGSSLPFGHRDIAARRRLFAAPEAQALWQQRLEAAVRRCDAMRDEQDRWSGKPEGSWRSAARKRDQAEQQDELDEKHGVGEARKRARVGREAPRLHRAERKAQDFEDEEQEADWDMAHEPRPDPALFDGMLD